MKENVLYDELLTTVSGGRVPSEDDFIDFINAMNQVDGKKCKFCNKVFSKNEVVYIHKSEMLKLTNEFVSRGRNMVPCFGCSRWRYIHTDFVF